MARFAVLICVFVWLATLAGAQTTTDPGLVVEPVIASGGTLNAPTSVAFLSAADILVTEKNTGQVRRVTNGVLQAGNVLDLVVNYASESGLLNIVTDPQFASNNRVYLYHTTASAASDTSVTGSVIDNRVTRFLWNGSALVSPSVVISLPALPGPNHAGGILAFGPPAAPAASQKLFVVVGDLNLNNQLENYASGAAPDDSGCILRVEPDGSVPTGAEAGPFLAVAGANQSLQRLFAYGVRNSFGMDFDPVTGTLWNSENGPNDYDELNRVEPAFNSGWEYVMGPLSRGSFKGAPGLLQFGGVGTYSDPEFSWLTPIGVTSLHFLRGTGLGASYQHDCFVGDINNGRIYRFEPNGLRDGFVLAGNLADLVLDPTDSNAPILFGTGFGGVTDIKTGPDGYMYVSSYGHGQIYRIRSASTAAGDWHIYP